MTNVGNHFVEIEMKGTWTRAALALVVAAGLSACGSAQADDTGPSEAEPQEFGRVINVEVLEVAPRPFMDQIRLTGVARANRDVQVAAEESGVIRRMFVDRGARVAQGQPLFKIDDQVLQAQVDQARAQAELARQTWERRKRLFEEDRVGSELAYLEARSAAQQTAANVRVLEERLARTTIRAPFAGVVDDRFVEVGSLVAPGQPVARVVDLNPVKVTAGVPERYAGDVGAGTDAVVLFNVLPDEEFPANIGFVGSTVDAQNRTFPVEIRMGNPGGLIKPEMVATILVDRRGFDQAVVIPQDALVRVEDGYVVFVAAEGDDRTVAHQRRVRLGPAQNNQVVVEEGLEAGDRLIVVGHKSVAHGDRINVVGT